MRNAATSVAMAVPPRAPRLRVSCQTVQEATKLSGIAAFDLERIRLSDASAWAIETRKEQVIIDALSAAVATIQLAGHDPSDQALIAIARRIASEANSPDATRLSLVEAGLDGSCF